MLTIARVCKECGKPYRLGDLGTGYKYCSRRCAKIAQFKQIERWTSENNISIKEWKDWYRMRKFQDKLVEYEEKH